MAVYEYQCKECGEVTETEHSISQRKKREIGCEFCGGTARPIMSLCGSTFPQGRCKANKGGLDRPSY